MPTKTLDNVVLSEFVELALGHTASYVNVSPTLAKQIEHADFDNAFIHIEWPSDANKLTRPRMWRIQEWRSSCERERLRKEESHKSRAVWVRMTEKRQHLMSRLRLATGLDDSFLEAIVTAALQKRDAGVFAVYGISLAELLAADDELNEFKKYNEYKRKTQTETEAS